MKQIIKCLSFLTAVMLIITSCPVCSVFASDGQSQDAIPADGLKIEVNPGKSSYDYSDTASIKVKVTNEYNFRVENVTVCIYSDDCKLPKDEKCISDKFSLDSGKSKTVQFHAKLRNTAKLNIFQRIVMFFRNLFNPTDYFKHIDDEEKESFECSELFAVRFGTIDCLFDTTVYYTYTMQEVDEDLEELLNSSDFEETYRNSVEDATKMVEDCLENMEEDGLVKSYSSDGESEVWFEYLLDNGKIAVGGVDLSPPEEGKNSSSNSAQAADGSDSTPDDTVMFFDALTLVNDFDSNQTVYNTICESFKQYNTSSGHFKFTYNNCKNLDCSKPSFVCLSSHGGETNKLEVFKYRKKPFVRLSDYPTGNPEFENDKAKKTVGTIFVKNIKYSILFPEFFKNKNFKNTVVFMESCCAFGGETGNTEFADALINSGCLAVIGFQYDVDDTYSADVLKSFIEHFRKGESLNKSLSEANEYAKSKMDKEPDLTTGILRYKFNNSGDETILDCGPNGGKQIGLRVSYEDTTGGANKTGSLFVFILDAGLISRKTKEETYDFLVNIALNETKRIEKRGNATVEGYNENGKYYDISLLIAN